MRTLAIGDIHGCLAPLELLWKTIAPQPDDRIVFLGDYVDRGPDSKAVIDFLLDLQKQNLNLTFLCGNHEEKLAMSVRDKDDRVHWIDIWGGDATVQSYGPDGFDAIPAEHWEFFRTLVPWYETENHIFVHACLEHDIPLARQLPFTLLHRKFDFPAYPDPHQSGKIMICGHTAIKSHLPLNIGHAVCIDTDPGRGGWLSCLHVESQKYWQSNFEGNIRTGELSLDK